MVRILLFQFPLSNNQIIKRKKKHQALIAYILYEIGLSYT